MKMRYFEEFLTLSEHLNFTSAARALLLDQSALSRHIARIEGDLGLSLVERDTHRVQLTPAGHRFAEGARSILEQYRQLLDTISGEAHGTLRIGMLTYEKKTYLDPVIREIERKYPATLLEYHFSYPDELIRNLLSGSIHLAIFPQVDICFPAAICCDPIGEENILLAVGPGHRLHGKVSVQLAALHDECFVEIGGTYQEALYAGLFQLLSDHGLSSFPRHTSTGVEDAFVCLLSGRHVLLVPGHLRDAGIASDAWFVEIEDASLRMPIMAAYHSKHRSLVSRCVSILRGRASGMRSKR